MPEIESWDANTSDLSCGEVERLRRQNHELQKLARELRHDLRNSLAALKGYITLLADDTEHIEYVEKAFQTINRVNDVLTRSVDLACEGEVVKKTESVSLKELIDEVLALTMPDRIRVNRPEFSLTVRGDHQLLFRMFKNMFENILVHGRPTTITIEVLFEDEACELHILNNGKPIAERKMALLNRGESAGDGIKIIKNVIVGHGWTYELGNKDNWVLYRIFIPWEEVVDSPGQGH